MKSSKPSSLVPKLRFPEFRDEPAWEETPIDEIARVTQGGTPDTSIAEYWGGPINWLTPAEMGKADTPYIRSTARTLTDLGLRTCSSELLPKCSVIVSTRAPIGHLAINTSPMAINQGCRGLVIAKDSCAYFIYSALARAKPRLNDLGAGNTFKELSGSALKSFPINIPSLAEQKKIADCLGSLDDLIAAEDRKLEALRQHKQGLMQQLFPLPGETVPMLRFPEFRDKGEWEVIEIGQHMDIKGRIGYRGYTVEDIVNCGEGAISLSPSNIDESGTLSFEKSTYISWAKYEESPEIMVERDFTLLVKTGSTYGKAAFVKDLPQECTVNPQIVVLKPTSIIPFFLYLLVVGRVIQNRIRATVVGGAIPTLSQENISQFKVYVPSPPEQQRIADCLSALDDQIAAQVQRLNALKTHKQGLLQQLFPSLEGSE